MIVTEEDIRRLGWETDYRQWERKFEELKKKISKVSDVKHGLYILKKANADSDMILEALTGVVLDLSMGWRDEMKRDQAKLVRAANALHSAAEAVEKVSRDPGCYPGSWMAILNRHATWNELKRQMFVPSKVLRRMRAYEKYALDIAKLFGEIRRKQAQLNRMEKIAGLVAYIQHVTGRNYDDEVARLITSAHEVVGSKKQFSADQLKKLRQRHIPKPQVTTPSFLEMLEGQFAWAGEAFADRLAKKGVVRVHRRQN